ncbi:MAG: segregation/condensation protein A [Candidatus Moranbacteria bacterium]|nr:segregation/condensation protein A [Candidatus Moranbacteria bacterium]NTW45442.1 segregation/condensation protein A [Candidatus Moranbacteria bacterium]
MSCHFRLSQFEGPLELLLSLIEGRKLDITQVSLAEVADQYLDRLSAERDAVSLSELSEFLVIAARLILIKSKMLLPVLVFTEEEEESMEDLERRLLEYKRFKDASEALAEMAGSGRCSYPREKFLGAPETFSPPRGLTAESLRRQFESVLGAIPEKERMIEEVIEQVVSLEERIATLQHSLRKRAEHGFRELIATARDRTEVIVSFLALLELVKQRFVTVDQGDIFGDIRITVSRDANEQQ